MTRIERWRKSCRSPNAYARSQAAKSVPVKAPFRAIAKDLFKLLSDEDEIVRAEAADSLGWFRERRVVAELQKRLKVEKSEFVLIFLLCSLASNSTGKELDSFKPFLHSDSAYLRVEALMGIALGAVTQAVSELRFALNSESVELDGHRMMPRFQGGAFGLLNRIGDALVDIKKYGDRSTVKAVQEKALSTRVRVLSEFDHVRKRVGRSKYGVTRRTRSSD